LGVHERSCSDISGSIPFWTQLAEPLHAVDSRLPLAVPIFKKKLYDLSGLWIIENFLPIGLEIEAIFASRVSRRRTDFALSG